MPLKERKPLEHRPTYNEIVAILQEGHGSTVDADLVDGLHAHEIHPISIGDPPLGHDVTKTEFDWNEDGSINTIKMYEGETLLFTLTFTWNPDGTLGDVTRTE